MQIEINFNEDDAECHECGKIGQPRTLLHFPHLCQHFVALCPRCFKAFRQIIHYT